MKRPSGSNFSDWVTGLKMRNQGCASQPVELAACGLRLGVDYPLPVVDHARARQRTLMRFSLLPESEIS